MRDAPSRRHFLAGASAAFAATAVAATGAAATLTALPGCATAPPAKASPPDVLLVTLCSARADRLGASGYATRPTTPNLDRFAATAARFSHAWANGTWTNAAHASLLTGLLPGHHRVEDQLDKLVPGAPTLPGLLAAAGWRTGALLQEQGAMTLDARSDLLRDVSKVLDTPDLRRFSPDALVEWIGRDAAPFFALVTLREAHLPYGDGGAFGAALHPDVVAWRAALPRPGSGEAAVWADASDPNAWIAARAAADPAVRASLDLAYDAGLAAADAAFGRLLTALEATGRLANAVVVVVGDHGEALPGHKDRLDRAVLRVPMLIRAAGLQAVAVADTVSQVDVLPTVLGLAGLPLPKLRDGQDLGPALRGEALPERGALSQAFPRDGSGALRVRSAYAKGALRVVQAESAAGAEPGSVARGSAEREAADGRVSTEPPGPAVDALVAEMTALAADTWVPAGPAAPVSAAVREQMRARGYW